MEQTACLVCGALDERALLRRAQPRHVVCRRCGMVYQNPRPTQAEIGAHYEQGYWEARGPVEAERKQPISAASLARGQFVVEWARRFAGAPERLVEIGCGRGEILSYIRDQLGCQAIGVEPSKAQAAAAAERFGLEMINGDLESLDLGERPANALVMCHVLEHFHDPRAALVRCRELLADGGWLFIEVPNILRPNPRKRLSRWLVFEHMSYFSAASLSRLLVQAGYRVVHTETDIFVRILAQKLADEPAMDAASQRDGATVNEYRQVLSALRRHELVYWPRYAVTRVVDAIASRVRGALVGAPPASRSTEPAN